MKPFMLGVMALTVIVLTVLKFSIVVPVTINESLKTYFLLFNVTKRLLYHFK